MKNQLLTVILMLTIVVTGFSARPMTIPTDDETTVIYQLKQNSMSNVTQKQIKEWKEKHPDIYSLKSEGRVGYIFDPTSKLYVMKMIFSTATTGAKSEITEAILNNCWLGGDQSLKDDEHCRNDLDEQVNRLLDIPDAEVIEHDDHAQIVVKDLSCKLKWAERGDIKYAENKNRDNKPFKTVEYLIDRIALDENEVAEIRKDDRSYMALLVAAKDLKRKKYVELGKV